MLCEFQKPLFHPKKFKVNVLRSTSFYRYERDPEGIRVIVGSSMRNSGGTALDVLKVIPHHSYSPLTLINDIAMIKTKTSMNFGVSLKAVDIPTPDFHLPDGSNVLVSGYGLMNVSIGMLRTWPCIVL